MLLLIIAQLKDSAPWRAERLHQLTKTPIGRLRTLMGVFHEGLDDGITMIDMNGERRQGRHALCSMTVQAIERSTKDDAAGTRSPSNTPGRPRSARARRGGRLAAG